MNKNAIIMDWLCNPENRDRLKTLEVSQEVFDFINITASVYDFQVDKVYYFGNTYFRLKIIN